MRFIGELLLEQACTRYRRAGEELAKQIDTRRVAVMNLLREGFSRLGRYQSYRAAAEPGTIQP